MPVAVVQAAPRPVMAVIVIAGHMSPTTQSASPSPVSCGTRDKANRAAQAFVKALGHTEPLIQAAHPWGGQPGYDSSDEGSFAG